MDVATGAASQVDGHEQLLMMVNMEIMGIHGYS